MILNLVVGEVGLVEFLYDDPEVERRSYCLDSPRAACCLFVLR